MVVVVSGSEELPRRLADLLSRELGAAATYTRASGHASIVATWTVRVPSAGGSERRRRARAVVRAFLDGAGFVDRA